jgi:hypothetical protein
LNKLEKILNTIDYAAIRKRRATYFRLFHAATILTRQNGGGISFRNMLFLLTHQRLIVDCQ